MGDLTRRGFIGILSSLPFVGRLLPEPKFLVAAEPAPALNLEPGLIRWVPDKCSVLSLSPPPGTSDRVAWLKSIFKFDREPDFLFSFTMPCCGHRVIIKSFETMPLRTLACPCGRPGFNVIEWPEVCGKCFGTGMKNEWIRLSSGYSVPSYGTCECMPKPVKRAVECRCPTDGKVKGCPCWVPEVA